MPDVVVFCEDSFHEKYVGALFRRLAAEAGVSVNPLRFLSSRGGLPRMHSEFKEFLRDLSADRRFVPDSVVVVLDANCEGYHSRKEKMDHELQHFPRLQQLVTYGIPDPHIERWMLIDPAAFRKVFGRGCTTPALKCAKNEYKKLLRQEIRESGIEAPLGVRNSWRMWSEL